MNEYEIAEQLELEDQAEFLRRMPYVPALDGWEIFTKVVAVLLTLDFIAMIFTWK